MGPESWSDSQQSRLEGSGEGGGMDPGASDGQHLVLLYFRTLARVLEPEVEMGRREGGYKK